MPARRASALFERRSDTLRAAVRALLLAIAGAIGALAWTRGLYANAVVALLVATWLVALAVVDRPALVVAPPAPAKPDTGEAERQRLTAYLDLSPAPLVALDPDGRLRVVNRAARRLLGAADLAADAPPALLAALAETPPGRTATVEVRDGDTARSFALATGDLALAGQLTRIGALIDIDAELKAAEAGALRELVQVLSHEIVNALTPIASLADTAAAMLDDPAPPLPAIREAVETVARRAASLHRFGESYRALARLPAPTPVRLAVPEMLGDLARLFATRWPAVALSIDAEYAPAHVVADADQLTAALWAVLQNAAEALHDAPAPCITLSVEARVDHVRIAIADNGPGIAAGAAEIFRPFFTTKPAGTGVGLALARQILRGHGGELVLDASAPGATRFAATVPAAG